MSLIKTTKTMSCWETSAPLPHPTLLPPARRHHSSQERHRSTSPPGPVSFSLFVTAPVKYVQLVSGSKRRRSVMTLRRRRRTVRCSRRHLQGVMCCSLSWRVDHCNGWLHRDWHFDFDGSATNLIDKNAKDAKNRKGSQPFNIATQQKATT